MAEAHIFKWSLNFKSEIMMEQLIDFVVKYCHLYFSFNRTSGFFLHPFQWLRLTRPITNYTDEN